MKQKSEDIHNNSVKMDEQKDKSEAGEPEYTYIIKYNFFHLLKKLLKQNISIGLAYLILSILKMLYNLLPRFIRKN